MHTLYITLKKLTQFEHHLANLLLYSLYQNHIHQEQSLKKKF